MSLYRSVLRCLENLKHRKRSQYKLIRSLNHFKYIVICKLENLLIKYVDIPKHSLNMCEDINVVCSLTSYPGRINECFYAIKSILLQSVTPNRVVLWLASSQFPNKKLPDVYQQLVKIGVEIRFCDDLRSHKKYFSMLQEQKPDEVVVTFDDDIIYHPDTIKRVLETHYLYPDCIVCNEAKILKLNESGDSLASYSVWRKASNGHKIPDIFRYSIMTGSGCLYPYGIMPIQTFDEEKIKKFAFTADDLWITFTAKAFGIRVAPTNIMARTYTTVRNSQITHLAQVNCLKTGNDDTVNRMFELYPQMKENLLKALI